MASILQRFTSGVRAHNKESEKSKEDERPCFFNEEDKKLLDKLSFEEQIVYKTQKMYRDPENGLCTLYRELNGSEPVEPERKINILVIGNHSSGKSTFINWYVEEPVQKTGVAMETSNFTVVCSGKRVEALTAGALVKLFPKLEIFEKIPGAMEHLSGEVILSTKNRFKFVNFIDSPGIVDGERYNYDFDRSLEVCAEMADLIFVFFDPHGQALCQRTLAHLERLCSSQPNKLSLWMTKCDIVKGEGDLVKVTQQISRELARRPIIARQELWLTPIYVPGHSTHQPEGLNNLPAVHSLIDKSIAAHLQNKVLRDIVQQCDYLDKLNAEKRAADERRRTKPVSGHVWFQMFVYLTIMAAAIAIGLYLASPEYLAECLENIVDPSSVMVLKDRFHKWFRGNILPKEMEMPALAGVLGCISVLAWLGAWLGAPEPEAEPVREDDHITSPWYRNNIDRINNIRQEAEKLFKEYLKLTVEL